MAEQITGAQNLIEKRGGCRVVAAELDWPYTTVHTFHRNDKAPKYRWQAIEALPVKAQQAAPPKPKAKRRQAA